MDRNFSDIISDFKFSGNKFILNEEEKLTASMDKFDQYIIHNIENRNVSTISLEKQEQDIKRKFYWRIQKIKNTNNSQKIEILDKIVENIKANSLKEEELLEEIMKLPEYASYRHNLERLSKNTFMAYVLFGSSTFAILVKLFEININTHHSRFPKSIDLFKTFKFYLLSTVMTSIFLYYQRKKYFNYEKNTVDSIKKKFIRATDHSEIIEKINLKKLKLI